VTPPLADSAGSTERLVRDHREIIARLADLRERLDRDAERDPGRVVDEVSALIDALHAHDALESELIGRGLALDRVTPSDRAPASRALEINLRRTAVDVIVPPDQRVLLEIVADRYGVHERTKKLLREINHPYVGWEPTLEELHRCASISGGEGNVASGFWSSISGGSGNVAGSPLGPGSPVGRLSSVSGGEGNVASDAFSSVSGGHNRPPRRTHSAKPLSLLGSESRARGSSSTRPLHLAAARRRSRRAGTARGTPLMSPASLQASTTSQIAMRFTAVTGLPFPGRPRSS